MAGVAFAGAPEIQSDFGVSYATAALVLFTLPTAVAVVVEPPLFLLAERWDRHRTVVFGIGLLGASLCGVGLSTGPAMLAIAMSLAFVGSGLGVSLAEAHLVDGHPEQREAVMARWTLMGVLGDLTAPLLLAGMTAISLGWRSAAGAIGIGLLVYAAVLAFGLGPTPAEEDEDEGPDEPGLAETVRLALGNRGLLRWSLGAACCTLLDEVFVAFGALYLAQELPIDPALRSLVLSAYLAGGLIGLIALERLLARGVAPLRLLRWSAAACGAAFALWLSARGALPSAACLLLLGISAVPLWPLAQARAYAQLPGRAVVVEAVSGLFTPLDLVAPLLLGWVADRWGLESALLLLLLQPLLLWLLSIRETDPS